MLPFLSNDKSTNEHTSMRAAPILEKVGPMRTSVVNMDLSVRDGSLEACENMGKFQ